MRKFSLNLVVYVLVIVIFQGLLLPLTTRGPKDSHNQVTSRPNLELDCLATQLSHT